MKIVLFRDGQKGVTAKMPGEDPAVELSDLLGGTPVYTRLNERLKLVTIAEGGTLELPRWYTLRRLGYEPEEILGDCAVVAVNPDGSLRDVSLAETVAAGEYVRRLTP
jgi:hypothetical protein